MVMPDLYRLITRLTTLMLLLAPLPALAVFQASVDRNPVAEGESLNLTLTSDESLDSNPDLSVLQQDFDVLGQSSGTNMQIINGSITRSVQWQIRLMPKRSGPLVIPAISAGGQSTQPIFIGVTKADQAHAAQQSGELFLEVSAEPRTAYVQQQIVFTVRLYRAVNIGNQSTLSDPKFPQMDALVQRLGDDRSYQATHNGQAYAVIERRYAVYPQKSGSFNSAPVQFDGAIIESARGRGGFAFDPFNQTVRQKRVSSKSLAFTIKPAPASMGGAQWLPASKLQLSEQWSENPPRFTAGEPITRTLVISASGLTASQLPALGAAAIDGLKLYPDQPLLKDNQDDNGVSGVRTQKIAILPTRSGNFVLPAIEVKWWNVNTDRMEVARLPARTITVLPGSANPGDSTRSVGLSAATSQGEPAELQSTSGGIPLQGGNLAATGYSMGWWPWLSLFLGTGWLVTLLLWWRARKRLPAENAHAANVEALRKLESQLKTGCLGNDAGQAKAKLLAWAKLRWPDNPPASLTAIAARCQPALADALNELDRALYAQDRNEWQGEKLWQSFNRDKPVAVTKPSGKDESLEPLFLASS